MKKFTKNMFVTVIALILLFGMNVNAEEYIDNNKNSIVQVITGYKTDSGEILVIKSGSGIVIEQSTVLTDYNLLHLSEKELKKRKKFIKKNYKYEIDITKQDNFVVVVVDKGDSVIETSVINESKEYGFSILGLSKAIERPSAILGDSNAVEVVSDVIIMGYPSVDNQKKDGNKFLSVEDINLLSGVVSELSDSTIRVGTKISKGNSGGALIDSNTGTVVGMIVYNSDDNEKECSRALPINMLKGYMGSITYTDAGAANQMEEEQVAEIAEIPIDKSELEKLIETAEQKESDLYTQESYEMMESCLQQAKEIIAQEEITQEEIDDTQKLLNNSLNSLEEVSTFNWNLLIIIILVVLVVIISVVLVIVLVKNSKAKKEKKQFQTIPQNGAYPNQFPNGNVMPSNMGNTNFNTTSGKLDNVNTAPANIKANNSTTVLNQNNQKGTTVLNAGNMQMTAYIIRKKNNESNVITGPEYTIGKDASIVDYCITGNEAISRTHLKIIKRGINYILIDLKSTNFTYINNEQVTPEKEYVLSSGDIIKIADEEFIFEIK